MLVFSVTLYGQEPKHPCKHIGLALSGGGARGAAQIGVLKVLEREGIKIDYIAGTSFGAIVGGLHACGYSAGDIETILVNHWPEAFTNQPVRTYAPLRQNQRLRQLIRLDMKGFNPVLPRGVLRGQHLMELLSRLTLRPLQVANYDFNNLQIGFWAVATNLNTGEPYIFKKGRLSEAIYASMALPAFFSPVYKDGILLTDGGLANNLPAKIVSDMGADIVIAVDTTSPPPENTDECNILTVTAQSIGLRTRSTLKQNDPYIGLVIQPNLAGYTQNSYDHVHEIVELGFSETESKIAEIREFVGKENLGWPPLKPPAGIDPTIDPTIESIIFETPFGTQPRSIPSSFLLRQIRSRPGDKMNPELVGADVERLYATSMFDQVDYECRPAADNRCSLVYHLTEASPNSLGMSLRYDREYGVQALAEFTARNLFGTPSYGIVSARLGQTGREAAAMRLIHTRLPFLFIEPEAQIMKRERFDIMSPPKTVAFLDKRRGVQLMVGATVLNRFEASAGYRFETGRFVQKGVEFDNEPATNLSGLRLHLRLDTRDHQEFPRSGFDADIKGDLKSPRLGADLSYSIVQGRLNYHFSPLDKTTFTLRLASFKSGGTIPYYERAFLGGYGFSDTASYRFLGYERDEFAVSDMAMAAVAYRRQLFLKPLGFLKRGYLSAEYNVSRMGGAVSGNTAGGRIVHGGAIGLAFDTMIGPARLAAGFGEDNKHTFYLSIGPSF